LREYLFCQTGKARKSLANLLDDENKVPTQISTCNRPLPQSISNVSLTSLLRALGHQHKRTHPNVYNVRFALEAVF
jgi:hypothetical protein